MACFHVNRELVVKGHISMYTLQGIDGERALYTGRIQISNLKKKIQIGPLIR